MPLFVAVNAGKRLDYIDNREVFVENQGVEMIDGLKILQLLYAKSVLKMLRYEGNILMNILVRQSRLSSID